MKSSTKQVTPVKAWTKGVPFDDNSKQLLNIAQMPFTSGWRRCRMCIWGKVQPLAA